MTAQTVLTMAFECFMKIGSSYIRTATPALVE
jgi:hypothetical protein